jgi:hypothetical protein
MTPESGHLRIRHCLWVMLLAGTTAEYLAPGLGGRTPLLQGFAGQSEILKDLPTGMVGGGGLPVLCRSTPIVGLRRGIAEMRIGYP